MLHNFFLSFSNFLFSIHHFIIFCFRFLNTVCFQGPQGPALRLGPLLLSTIFGRIHGITSVLYFKNIYVILGRDAGPLRPQNFCPTLQLHYILII